MAVFTLPLTDPGKTRIIAIFRNELVDYKQYGTLVWEEKGSIEAVLSFLSAQGCLPPVARISVEVMQKRGHGWEKQILESVDTAGPGGPVTSLGHTHLGCTPIWAKPEARLNALR